MKTLDGFQFHEAIQNGTLICTDTPVKRIFRAENPNTSDIWFGFWDESEMACGHYASLSAAVDGMVQYITCELNAPTTKMLRAGADAILNTCGDCITDESKGEENAANIYSAMVLARR